MAGDVTEQPMPEDNFELALLAGLAAGASKLPTHADAATQTEALKETETPGVLQLFLSICDGQHGETQVEHADEHTARTSTVGSWKRKCGFEGYRTLTSSEKALQDLCGVTMTVFSILLNLLPEQRQRASDVSREDRLAILLMKLKLGVSLTAIAALFGVTKSTACRVFHTTLDQLSAVTREWIFVPPRETIKETLPPCFQRHYPDCTFIIDYTEVTTETPSGPEQHYLYSHYKGGYTLKWLVGIIPNGAVAFLSKPYGGRHSDSFITRDSGFLAHVLPGDVVLSDKGFPAIKTTFDDKGAVLVMPPFNTGGRQLSVEDMETTFVIAQVRVHVERTIQRLKLFNILNNRVSLTLIPHMGKMMHICACLVNFQAPIINS
ncbi:uncharacterized protein LOC135378425 [Ornithodoros turicata]|uniref:uncharacterized protein LOC135378425 n=1 Tax=Ornithodoros turicata TaxID=34597 RepID=UPI00313A46D2